MKNKKFKFAFTIAELLIVMAFIGFIVIHELVIINSKINQYGAQYYNVYNSLRSVVYNIFVDMYCPDKTKPDGDPCREGPREFPTESADPATELCLRFGEYLNIADNNLYCTDTSAVDDSIIITSDEGEDVILPLRFKVSNSTKFYIDDNSKNLYTYNFKDAVTGKDESIKYFIVYVDINGEQKPNRLDIEDGSKIYPDIVPFGITEKGEVIPMGYPTYSSAYMTAKIRYPDKIDKDNLEEKPEENLSETMPYNDAINKAWGDKETTSRPFTYRLTDKMNDNHPAKKFFAGKFTNPSQDTGNCSQILNCSVVIDNSEYVRF